MSLPALQAIRGRFPRAHIAVLARPWVADLYARESFADRVILLTSGRGAQDLGGIWRAAQSLRAERFDCAILLQNAFEAALIAWLARIPRRIGYSRDGRGLLLTDPIRLPGAAEIPRHQRFYYLEMLRRAGILVGDLPDGPIRLEKTAGAPGRIVGVSPGAAFGSAKRWPPGRFAEAAAELAAKLDCTVAVFGSKDERELCELVTRLVEARGLTARNFAGETTLRDFIELVAGCRVYLTNDSGAMHVACALGVPTVAVFGSTDEAATGPVGAWTRVVREPVDCSPCLLRECPTDHRCMERVAISRVVAAALDLVRS